MNFSMIFKFPLFSCWCMQFSSLHFIIFSRLKPNLIFIRCILKLKLILSFFSINRLILPELKIICLCHQYRARSAVWPSSILLADHLQVFTMISLKWYWTVPKRYGGLFCIRKFDMVRVLKKSPWSIINKLLKIYSDKSNLVVFCSWQYLYWYIQFQNWYFQEFEVCC